MLSVWLLPLDVSPFVEHVRGMGFQQNQRGMRQGSIMQTGNTPKKQRALERLQGHFRAVLSELDTSTAAAVFLHEVERLQADAVIEDEQAFTDWAYDLLYRTLVKLVIDMHPADFQNLASTCTALGATADEIGLMIYHVIVGHSFIEQVQREICTQSGLPLAPPDRHN
jgi:hypothetical protein